MPQATSGEQARSEREDRCDHCGFPQAWHVPDGFGDCPIIFDVLGRRDGLEQIKRAVAHLDEGAELLRPRRQSPQAPTPTEARLIHELERLAAAKRLEAERRQPSLLDESSDEGE